MSKGKIHIAEYEEELECAWCGTVEELLYRVNGAWSTECMCKECYEEKVDESENDFGIHNPTYPLYVRVAWLGDEKMRTQMRIEILGITMNREEHYDSNGRIRLFWVLRDENGHIVRINKTWEDMVMEMMFETVRANQWKKKEEKRRWKKWVEYILDM